MVDSIAEIFISGYFNVDQFRKFLDSLDASDNMKLFLIMIKNYVSTFNLTTLYKLDRFEVIIETFAKDVDQYCWNASIREFFQKIM